MMGKHSEKTKEKIRLSKIGKKRSEETKRKISLAHKGRKHSEEIKRKLSETAKKNGSGKWMVGKKHSKETKEKMSKAQKGRKVTWGDKISKGKKGKKQPWVKNLPQNFKKGITVWNKGKKGLQKHSEEWKRNMSNALKGEKSYLWKGGVTPFHLQIRHCFKYRQWRSDVFTRDDFTCQHCGAKSGNGKAVYLEAHHIKSFSQIIQEYKVKTLEKALDCEELWNINNGITLCQKCHNKTRKGRIK